jgi:hypothetical protein
MPIAFPDPFFRSIVTLSFAMMNPGIDNGPYSPFSSIDLFRSDVYSYAGGEGIAILRGYAVTGGIMITYGSSEGQEIGFVPLANNVWENISISYNFAGDLYSIKLNGTELFSGSIINTFSPGWTIDQSKATFTIYTGSQYAIDEFQRALEYPPANDYLYYNSLSVRNGYDGDVGVAGYLPTVPLVQITGSQLQDSYVLPALRNEVGDDPGYSGSPVLGAGLPTELSATIPPMTVGSTNQYTTMEYGFHSTGFYFPMMEGDDLWIVAADFTGYGQPWTLTVAVGPYAGFREFYDLTGTSEPYEPMTYTITRTA